MKHNKIVIAVVCLLLGLIGSTVIRAQSVQHIIPPGGSIEIVAATCEVCPTCAVPTATMEPTATNTPEPTATPQPSAIRFGPMDLTANGTYDQWADVFDLARDFHDVPDALGSGYELIIPAVLSHSRCESDGAFDYARCEAEVLAKTTSYASACQGGGCIWYVADEPHDWPGGPTYAELDALCGVAKSVLNAPCGYNAPATWMLQGAPFQHIDMSLSQTNFGRVSGQAAWASWANETMGAARQFADTVYLSFNSETYSPSADDYADAMAGICQAQPRGVTFWSFRMPHTQATMTHEVAARLHEICNGTQPTPEPTQIPPTETPAATNTPTPEPGGAVVIDHNTEIPADWTQAEDVSGHWGHASIGNNIDAGLASIGFNGSLSVVALGADNTRPLAKIATFEARAGGLDAAFMKFCVGDAEHWSGVSASEIWNAYRAMAEREMAAHPGTVFVWWTQPLTSVSDGRALAEIGEYNTLVRDYVGENGGVLFDIADIESDGGRCSVGGLEALCNEWTTDGAHLNGAGSERLGRFFVAMLDVVGN